MAFFFKHSKTSPEGEEVEKMDEIHDKTFESFDSEYTKNKAEKLGLKLPDYDIKTFSGIEYKKYKEVNQYILIITDVELEAIKKDVETIKQIAIDLETIDSIYLSLTKINYDGSYADKLTKYGPHYNILISTPATINISQIKKLLKKYNLALNVKQIEKIGNKVLIDTWEIDKKKAKIQPVKKKKPKIIKSKKKMVSEFDKLKKRFEEQKRRFDVLVKSIDDDSIRIITPSKKQETTVGTIKEKYKKHIGEINRFKEYAFGGSFKDSENGQQLQKYKELFSKTFKD